MSWVTATSPEPLFTSEPPPTPEGYVAIGPFDGTGYVNPDSYDIRKIKPYAAYEVVSQRWFVEPISEPEGHHFTESDDQSGDNHCVHRQSPAVEHDDGGHQ